MVYGYLPSYVSVTNLSADEITTDSLTITGGGSIVTDTITADNVIANNDVSTTTLTLATTPDFIIRINPTQRFIHNYQNGGTGRNLFFGPGAGNRDTIDNGGGASYLASNNIGIGVDSLKSLTSGYANLAIGPLSLQNLTTGAENVCLGYEAMSSSITTGSTVAIGTRACYAVTTGGGHVGVGRQALSAVSTNDNCVGVGSFAGQNTTGHRNTFVGKSAGQGVSGSSGNDNTAVGYNALSSLTGGGNTNVIFGSRSGANITTGSTNVIVGYNLSASSATVNNELNIANAIRGNHSSALIGVGVSSAPAVKSTLETGGSFGAKVQEVSGASATLDATAHVISVTNTGGPTLTLPAASTAFNSTDGVGRVYIITDTGLNATASPITIQRNGSDTILTSSSVTSYTISSDGGTSRIVAISTTSWKVI